MENKGSLYYFISDVHLGLDFQNPLERERKLVRVLEGLPAETEAVFLMGDIFDFWYEYKYVVPKGFTRTLGALARLSDRGVKLYFFRGNHDLWVFGYFEKELGIKILEQPSFVDINGKQFCLGHGDGLPGGDRGYAILKSIFYNKFLQWAFSNIHPRWAFGLAHKWSKHNRLACDNLNEFRGERDPLYKYACITEQDRHVDYFVFGHVHTPGNNKTLKGAGFYILGEWIHGCEYLVYDSEKDTMEWRSGNN